MKTDLFLFVAAAVVALPAAGQVKIAPGAEKIAVEIHGKPYTDFYVAGPEVTKPYLQHGTYSFFFWDADDNCWEILTNPEGGYRWIFNKGDLEGRGHLDRNFKRPGVNL